MHDKQKSINLNNPDALLKVLVNSKLVKRVFVNHMSNLTQLFCYRSVSFARQYMSQDLTKGTF